MLCRNLYLGITGDVSVIFNKYNFNLSFYSSFIEEKFCIDQTLGMAAKLRLFESIYSVV